MRRPATALLGLVLTTGAGAVVAAPADATVTTLCSGYTSCEKAGMGNAGYAKAGGTMYWRMYSGHNCTNYAAYRMVQAGLPNARPWTGGGNATNWGSAMSQITTSTPTVGAVAWWKAGVKPAGSVGHVGYVERVVSADEIIVSQDSWHGDFSWTRITRASSGWPSGFVHFSDVRLANVTAPGVSGTPKVGGTLTATPGTWSLAGATFSYQWLADGAPVTGATASTLALTRPLVGKRLSVKVVASGTGFAPAAATSAPSGTVLPGVLTSQAAPTVTGEPRVDQTVTASAGPWTPTPDAVAYRWLADGVAIKRGDGRTFVPGADEVGHALSVRVTATKDGYPDLVATSTPTTAVERGVFALESAPEVTGRATPGQTLGVVRPAVPEGATTRVLWRRANVVVPGATAEDYQVTAADLGSRILAQVLVAKPGYTPVIRRSFSTDVVRAPSSIRLAATPGTGSLTLTATVLATAVPSVEGVLQVRSRGRLLGSVPVDAGRAIATVTGLPRGTRTYRFRLLTTSTVLGGTVERRLTIR